MKEIRHVHDTLAEKPHEKKYLGRPQHRWKDNIKIYLRKMRLATVNLIHMPQGKDRWRTFMTTVYTSAFNEIWGIS
jgi:hypothetical protein